MAGLAKTAHAPAETQRRASWERMSGGHHGPLITAAALPGSFLPFTGLPLLTAAADGGNHRQGEGCKLRADSVAVCSRIKETWAGFGIEEDADAQAHTVPSEKEIDRELADDHRCGRPGRTKRKRFRGRTVVLSGQFPPGLLV